MAKIEIQGIDDKGLKRVPFVDEYGKLRTGVVEYIKLIAQKNNLSGVTVGTSTATPTTYNTVLMYPLPFHSDVVGDDYIESTLSVTAAAGSTASSSGSLSATFVSTLCNKIVRVKGDVILNFSYTLISSATSGTVEITTATVEFGKIDTDSGTKTALASKTITINRSTTGTITESIAIIFQEMDFSLEYGERVYISITLNYTYTVNNTGTASVTDTATVRLNCYRGSDDTHILIPVVM